MATKMSYHIGQRKYHIKGTQLYSDYTGIVRDTLLLASTKLIGESWVEIKNTTVDTFKTKCD